MSKPGQTVPNIQKVLIAIAELEKHPAVAAYILLKQSIEKPERPR